MDAILVFKNKGDYLLAEASGNYSLEPFLSIIHKVADRCQGENLNKGLLDLRNMEGNPGILDRYRFGIEIAKVWGPRLKVATVARPEAINKMGETTAVNRGANLWVTPDFDLALKWLGVENK